jgi:hypothetical protein
MNTSNLPKKNTPADLCSDWKRQKSQKIKTSPQTVPRTINSDVSQAEPTNHTKNTHFRLEQHDKERTGEANSAFKTPQSLMIKRDSQNPNEKTTPQIDAQKHSKKLQNALWPPNRHKVCNANRRICVLVA